MDPGYGLGCVALGLLCRISGTRWTKYNAVRSRAAPKELVLGTHLVKSGKTVHMLKRKPFIRRATIAVALAGVTALIATPAFAAPGDLLPEGQQITGSTEDFTEDDGHVVSLMR